MLLKTYSGFITKLEPHQIFVFGSNTKGIHGAGAALAAYKYFGAKYGQAKGLQGQSYAIVTKDLDKGLRSISLEEIWNQVQDLYEFARENPKSEFLIAYSANGVNLNGYSNNEMAGVFWDMDIPINIVFEKDFHSLVYGWDDAYDSDEG